MADFILNVKVNGVEQTVSTMAELEKALELTNAELSGLEVGSREFKSLTTQANNLDKVIVALKDDTSGFNDNVKKTTQSTQKLGQTISQTADAATELGKAPTGELGKNVETATKSATSLRAQLKKTIIELQNLEPGSARFQELSLRAGQLKDEIADTNAIVGNLAGNTTERLGNSLNLAFSTGLQGLSALKDGLTGLGVEIPALDSAISGLQTALGFAALIQFAGSLPDIFTNLRNGFGSLIKPIRNYILGLSATTAATEGAAVATTTLGVAQRAIPILAIAAGIALLTAALIDYFQASQQASKEEEQRAKRQEEETQNREQLLEQLASESQEFTSLVFRLKQTNAQSKTRSNLISEINGKYGTTIANIKDENKFQEVLNGTIKDFITLKLTEFKLKSNKKEQDKLIRSLAESQMLLNQAQSDEIKNRQQNNEIAEGDAIRAAVFKISTDNTTKALSYKVKEQQKLIDQEKELINKLFPQRKKADGERTGGINKEAENLQKLNDILDKYTTDAVNSSLELDRQRITASNGEINRLNFELALKLDASQKEFDEDVKKVNGLIKNAEKRKEFIEKISLEQAKIELNIVKKNILDIEKLREKELGDIEQLYKDEILAREVLQKEIIFGNNNTNDLILESDRQRLQSELSLTEAQISDLNVFEIQKLSELNSKKEGLKKELDDILFKLEKERIQTETKLLNDEQLKRIDDLKLFNLDYQSILDGRKDIQIELDKEATDVLLKEQDERFAALNLALQKQADLEKVSAGIEIKNATDRANKIKEIDDKLKVDLVINETKANEERINLQDKLNQLLAQKNENLQTTLQNIDEDGKKKLEIAQNEFDANLLDNAEQTAGEQLSIFIDASIKVIEEFVGLANTVTSAISDIISTNQAARDEELTQIENDNIRRTNTINQNYNDELKSLQNRYNGGLISQDQYNQASTNLEQQRTGLIDGLGEELTKKQGEFAQKAFEEDKKLKIAQTIISGLRGAIDAYTSAAPLGPIAGPIVGAALAAIITTSTAKAVNQIRQTRFAGAKYETSVQPQSANLNPGGFGGGGSSAGNLGGGGLPDGGGFTGFNTQNLGTPGSNGTTAGQSGGQSGIQKVVVLESDITEVQRRVRVLESQSTFS